MKKNILAIAIASAVAAPVAMADAPKVYGQMNLAIDNITDKGMNVVHRNSRVGVKGSEDLGNGLKAVYQAEGTIGNGANFNGAANTANNFGFDRNTFAGLAGGFGTVVMGRHDTPLRMIQPSDGFADSAVAGNNTSRFNGFADTTGAGNASGEDRLNNVLAYLSPNFNGISFAVAGVSVPAQNKDATITNALSYTVAYGTKKSGIYVAAGMTTVDKKVDERSNMRVTAQYNEGGLLASFMYNDIDRKADAQVKGNSMTAGVAYKMGAITPRAKVAMISYSNGTDKSSQSMAVGADYALGKTTRVYAEFASVDKNNRANNWSAGKDVTAMSVGFFHKF